MPRRRVEKRIALRRIRGLDVRKYPIYCGTPSPELSSGKVLPLSSSRTRLGTMSRSLTVHRAQPYQEEAVLRHARIGALANLGQPLGFEYHIDDVSQCNPLPQGVGAYRERFPPSPQEDRKA